MINPQFTAWHSTIFMLTEGSLAKTMNRNPSSLIGQKVSSIIITGFLFWLTWTGVGAIIGIIQDGRIINRRGPDVHMSEHPILFWALSGFFSLGIILVTGLALICMVHGISLFRRAER